MKALKLINESKNHMNDKELLLEAIDNYSLFTQAQRVLLKVLVNINIDNTVTTSVEELSKLAESTKTTIYKSLNLLEEVGAIEKIKGPNKGIGIIKLKINKLNEIQEIYVKKYNLVKK